MSFVKKILFTVVFLCLCAGVFFAVGEIAFRLAKGKSNPLYDITQKNTQYLFAPGMKLHQVSSVDGEYDYFAHINSFGYRGKDFDAVKPAGVARVLVMGDSFTFGVGVEDEQTIPSVLETILAAQDYPVQVINAGIGHASPIRHYVNFRDIHSKFKPDVVVLLLDLTDLWDDWHSERNAVYDNYGDIARFDPTYINGKKNYWITMMNYSAFCQWIDKKIVRTFTKIQALGFLNYMKAAIKGKRAKGEIATSESVLEDKKIEHDGLLFMRGESERNLITKHWQRTAKYISKIKDLCLKENIPFVLVMYPHGIYAGENEWNEGRKTWNFETGKVYTDYLPFDIGQSYAERENIIFINALTYFITAPKDKKYFFDWDGHMTQDGYRLVAEAIAQDKNFLKLLNKKNN